MIIRAYLDPFFSLSIGNDRLSIGSKKKAKNNLVTATVIMILYEHTHQAGETTDDKYIQVKPLYLILFHNSKGILGRERLLIGLEV